jgi:hypothetical protein
MVGHSTQAVLTDRSTLTIFAHLPLPGTTAKVLAPGLAFQPSFALLFITGYEIYYLLLEPFAGVGARCRLVDQD